MIQKFSVNQCFKSIFRNFGQELGVKIHREPITVENQYDRLDDAVTPLSRIPYADQLRMKHKNVRETIKEIRDKLKIKLPKPSVYPVSPSPKTEYYRNKNEFNFRMGADGDPKTLGFFVGRPRCGDVICIRPTHLLCVSQRHKNIAAIFEEYVKRSPFPACHDLNDGGYWRGLTVRTNDLDETMAIVLVHPRDRKKEELEAESREVLEHFEQNNSSLYSLYYQCCTHVRCTRETSILRLVSGEPHLYENLFEYKFRISPGSFFQINKGAAEILYSEVFRIARLQSTSTVLDLCCGSGIISILSSKFVRNAIGVDEVYTSIEDAQFNASFNNVTNCEFIPGRVEITLNPILDSLEAPEVTVFANPGRGGLHNRTIQILRRSPNVRTVVFISCEMNHSNVIRNIGGLLKDDEKLTQPFQLRCVKPVDLFPHTNHCETIMLFTRL